MVALALRVALGAILMVWRCCFGGCFVRQKYSFGDMEVLFWGLFWWRRGEVEVQI